MQPDHSGSQILIVKCRNHTEAMMAIHAAMKETKFKILSMPFEDLTGNFIVIFHAFY